MSKFSNRLRELRKSRNLSQQRFADLIGTSKSSINMYERGEREPGIETLESIADFFNVDMDYLLGKSENPNSLKTLQLFDEETLKCLVENIKPNSSKEISAYVTLLAKQILDKNDTLDVVKNADEKNLLSDYRELTADGRKYIQQTMHMAKDTYKKVYKPTTIPSTPREIAEYGAKGTKGTNPPTTREIT